MDTKVKIISMDEIQAEEIKWLWKPYMLQRILFDAIICRIRKIKTSHF